MAGQLILVSGLSGAGKTTLIRAALGQIPQLAYLRTVTTRPRRPGESDGIEYQFVSSAEYEELRSHSANWDHSEYQGYKYGTDVAAVRELLRTKPVICALAPDEQIFSQMRQLYEGKIVTVWIDTPASESAARVGDDKLRAARQEDDSMKTQFDYIFTPADELRMDQTNFIAQLRQILATEQ